MKFYFAFLFVILSVAYGSAVPPKIKPYPPVENYADLPGMEPNQRSTNVESSASLNESQGETVQGLDKANSKYEEEGKLKQGHVDSVPPKIKPYPEEAADSKEKTVMPAISLETQPPINKKD